MGKNDIVALKGIQFVEMDLDGKLALTDNQSIPIDYILATEVEPNFCNTLAYPIGAAKKSIINQLFCCFQLSPLFDKNPGDQFITLSIRAVDIDEKVIFCQETSVDFYRENSWFSIYPNKARVSDFYTAFVPIAIDLNKLTGGVLAVQSKERKLLWQWAKTTAGIKPEWFNIHTTSFFVSLLIAPPTYPWTGTYSFCSCFEHGKCNCAEPEPYAWAPILKWVCCWAEGTNDLKSAATLICKNLSGLSKSGLQCPAPKFVYQTDPDLTKNNLVVSHEKHNNIKRGRPITEIRSWTKITNGKQSVLVPSQIIFYGTSMLQYFDGMYGFGNKVNCTDVATMMMYLANALGCELSVARITPESGSITTNPVFTLGSDAAKPSVQNFSFHDIAYCGDINEPDKMFVYDPCFSFTDPHNKHAIGMPYSDYKTALFANPENVNGPVKYSTKCTYCIV